MAKTYTTNSNLEKDDANEFYDVMVQSRNMDKIDTQLLARVGKTELSELLMGARNINLVNGGEMRWGIVPNTLSWSKVMSIYPAGGKLLQGGVAITNINIAIGSAVLAAAGDCMYITIPAINGATAAVAVAQFSAITGIDKLILAVRDTDSCLELLGGGWLTYGTIVEAGGKRDNYVPKSIVTAANDFIVGTGNAVVAKKTLAEIKTILGINAATESAAGVVEFATAAETTTGTDATRAVHPAGLKVELDKKANLASPTLTGTPLAPTAAVATNNTQIASTAYVRSQDIKGQLTVDNASWVASGNARFPFKKDVVVTGAVALDKPVSFDFTLGTYEIAEAAGIMYVECYAGGITLYAAATPTGSVIADYIIRKA